MTECKHKELRRWDDTGTWGCVEPKCAFVLRTTFDEPNAGCLNEGLGPMQLAMYKPGPDSKMLQDQEHGRFVFLKAVLELSHQTWPVPSVLNKLIEAAEYLLGTIDTSNTHQDSHRSPRRTCSSIQEYRSAVVRAKEILANWGWAERVDADIPAEWKDRVRVDEAVITKIAQNAYWKDDPVVVTLQPDDVAIITIHPQTERIPPSPPPENAVHMLTMKHDALFEHCITCDTPNVCPMRGCGKLMRERLSAHPLCTCVTNPKLCLRHNSFIDNAPKQLGAVK
jgi:hypothetical protein